MNAPVTSALPAQRLDWSGAFCARLQGLSAENSAFAGRAGDMAARLQKEVSAGLLPYLSMPYRAELEQQLPAVLAGLKNFKHMLLLGIGGSALGARALQKAFFPAQDRPGHSGPWLWIADNIDADTLDAWMTSLNPADTCVVVISKSGGTIETMAQYFLVKRWLATHLGDAWKKHVVLVTDAAKGQLRAEAAALSLAALPVPDNLGGRYSVLSAVGLLPAAWLGMDWKALLDGAASVAAPLLEPGESLARNLAHHPAWRMAVWARELMDHGYDELIFFSYMPLWNYFGAWFSQLWAESLGKEGKGSMPVPAVGVTDQHSVNQMFLDGPRNKGCLFVSCEGLDKGQAFGNDMPEAWDWLNGKHFGDLLLAEGLGTRMALIKSQVPLLHVAMNTADEAAAGKLMGLCMSATILTGWLMDINPIDQPAVELGKRLANARLGAPGLDAESRDLAAFLQTQNSAFLQEF